jgi:hypothetical protein
VADGTTPVVGLMLAMPQQWAGLRSEPPMSLPSPIALIPLASAEASPPLDPPAVTFGFHGLRVRPCSDESVWTRRPRSGRLLRPIGIAPAARIRATTGASIDAIASARATIALVVGVPARSMFSFTVNGTPCRGGRCSPLAWAASAASAAALASVASTRTIALRWGLTASIRARWASITSRLDTSPERIRAARPSALSLHNSVVLSVAVVTGGDVLSGLWAASVMALSIAPH